MPGKMSAAEARFRVECFEGALQHHEPGSPDHVKISALLEHARGFLNSTAPDLTVPNVSGAPQGFPQGGGQGRGRSYNSMSPKQQALLQRLLSERDMPADLAQRVRDALSAGDATSSKTASALIDKAFGCPEKVTAYNGPTDAQASTLLRMLGDREHSFVGEPEDIIKGLTKRQASQMIDSLMRAPRKAQATPKVEIEQGVYLVDGTVYKVQRAVHGSGNLYAKRLVGGSFEYAPGALRLIQPEHRMTLEQAKEYGALYGVCCNCGRTLTDEKSIAAAIGPVCAKRFA